MYPNPWLFDGKPFDTQDIPEEAYGFVYCVENTLTGRKYIGKKFFWKVLRRKVAGRKNRKVVKSESDWKKYYGSNKELLEDLRINGEEHFKRSIVRICNNKTECAYYEMKAQIDLEVLLREDYYNEFIGGKIVGRNLL